MTDRQSLELQSEKLDPAVRHWMRRNREADSCRIVLRLRGGRPIARASAELETTGAVLFSVTPDHAVVQASLVAIRRLLMLEQVAAILPDRRAGWVDSTLKAPETSPEHS